MEYLKEHYDNSLVVDTMGSSNLAPAFYYGVSLSGTPQDSYYNILNDQFPNSLVYIRWIEKKFVTPESLDVIRSKLTGNQKFIFLCDNQEILNEFMADLKKLTDKPNAEFKKVFE